MFKSKRARWSALIAAAAVIVLAIGFWPGKAGRSPGSVFAAAIERIQTAKTIVCRISAAYTGAGVTMQQTGRLEVSSDYGSRCELGTGGTTSIITYGPLQGPTTTVTPLTRSYTVTDMTALAGPGQKSPGGESVEAFMLALRKLKGQASRELGQATVDGVASLGYEISGEVLGLGPAAGVRSELWVDASTSLPVRYLAEIPMPATDDGNVGTVQVIYDQFQWDTPLDASRFTPDIPADYTRVEAKAPAVDEAALIKALGNYAELAGKYPPALDAATIATDLASAIGTRLGNAAVRGEKGPDQQELAQKAIEIGSGFAFYQQLVNEHRSPEYFGKTVSPGQKEPVLVRWKTPDGQWRVIYGDLHAETIAQ